MVSALLVLWLPASRSSHAVCYTAWILNLQNHETIKPFNYLSRGLWVAKILSVCHWAREPKFNPQTHPVEAENWLLQVVFWLHVCHFPHTFSTVYVCSYIQTAFVLLFPLQFFSLSFWLNYGVSWNIFFLFPVLTDLLKFLILQICGFHEN